MQINRAEQLAREYGMELITTRDRMLELHVDGKYEDELHPVQLAEMSEVDFVDYYLVTGDLNEN